MKKIIIILAAVVGVLVLAAVLAVVYVDALVKKGVETVGPQATRAEVKLEKARLRPFKGSGRLNGLFVGNPAGYKTESAIKVGELDLELVPGSLLSEKVHVKSIAITAPEITLEGGLKENNLTRLLANVQEFSGSSTNQTESQKKLQVDSLRISGAKVTASLNLVGGKPVTVTLPEIHLANLGQGPEGITAGDLTARVLDALVTRTLTSVAEAAGRLGKEALESAKDIATEAAKGAAVDAAKGAADKAAKRVTDLFKKKD